MDILTKLNSLADKIKDSKSKIGTEEAMKTAFVLPFLNALGYDIFDPTEVVPEFTADVGIKKGEKVDYAIFQENQPIMIIECKFWKEDLNLHNSQLFRYFHVTKARFALLTNGIEYKFYSDLEVSNKMDDKPFFEFNILELRENTISELSKFHKSNFDVDKILKNASSLKYMREIKRLIEDQINDPSDDFVKMFASKVYDGKITAKVLDKFKDIVKKSYIQFVSEKVNNRLKSALSKEQESVDEKIVEEEVLKIHTTEEELDGFRIVKAILRKDIELSRIYQRDTKSYFGIILDDNNRKPICRLHLNGNKKYIGIFDQDKKESRHQISSLDDIYNYDKEILDTISFYE